MRPALKRNDKPLSQLSFGTKKCIWPKGWLRNTFYLFILNYAPQPIHSGAKLHAVLPDSKNFEAGILKKLKVLSLRYKTVCHKWK